MPRGVTSQLSMPAVLTSVLKGGKQFRECVCDYRSVAKAGSSAASRSLPSSVGMKSSVLEEVAPLIL